MKKLFYLLTFASIIYSCGKNDLESISEEIDKNKQYDTIFINNGDTLRMYKKDIMYNIYYDSKTGKYYDAPNKNLIPFFGEWKLFSQGKQIRIGSGIHLASDDFEAYDEIHILNDTSSYTKLGVHCYNNKLLQKKYYGFSYDHEYTLRLYKFNDSGGSMTTKFHRLYDTHFKGDTLIINCPIKNKYNKYENFGLKYLRK